VLGQGLRREAVNITDPSEREALFQEAEIELKMARDLNPYNPIYTTELARLYRIWALYSLDPENKKQRIQKSHEHFSQAVKLSPLNAKLWDEWAVLYIDVDYSPEDALKLLRKAIEIDVNYDWTYALVEHLLLRYIVEATYEDTRLQNSELEDIKEIFYQAKEKGIFKKTRSNLNLNIVIAELRSNFGNTNQAVGIYQKAERKITEDFPHYWRIRLAMARMYAQNQKYKIAVRLAEQAFDFAPAQERPMINLLIEKWRSMTK